MQTRSCVIREEKRAVLDDWAANKDAKLVAMQQRLGSVAGRVEIVSGIQGIVPQVLVRTAVELVCPRLQGGIDRRSAASKLRLHSTFFYFKFSNRVWRRVHRNRAVSDSIVVHAIQQEIVVEGPQTIHR